MRLIIILLGMIAAGAAFFVFGGDRRASELSGVSGVGDRIKNVATTVIVKEIENPECTKLLDNIKRKTAAVVQKSRPPDMKCFWGMPPQNQQSPSIARRRRK